MNVVNIVESIEHWGKIEPNRPVYYSHNQIFSYGELKKISDQIAYYLIQHTEKEQPVVIFGELEFDMVCCFLGCSKAGRTYIPIDSHTPKERIEMILEVAQPSIVFSVGEWPLQETNLTIQTMDEVTRHFADPALTGVLPFIEGKETYYIIFTSGTTGAPKGVQTSHDNLKSFVQWELSSFGIKEGMNFLVQAPYSFDLSVMGLYPALVSGGSLTPLPKAIVTDFKILFEELLNLTCDVWISTPSFMEICLMDPKFNEEYLKKNKIFLFCGEELPKRTANTLLDRFPKGKIFNTYGPTEATVAVTSIQVTNEILETYSRIPIGFVKEDTNVYIMDGNKELNAGEVGEIIITGPSISKGYLHNPEKTKEAFFEYKNKPAYRTGDAGKMEDDLLLYEGRIDFQVKIHGYRIELEEVDHHLANVSYVKQATVVPKYQQHKVQQLVAFVVSNDHSFEKDFLLTKAIKQELSQYVMNYMIPHKFIYVDELPLTQNGKIDRKRLEKEVNP